MKSDRKPARLWMRACMITLIACLLITVPVLAIPSSSSSSSSGNSNSITAGSGTTTFSSQAYAGAWISLGNGYYEVLFPNAPNGIRSLLVLVKKDPMGQGDEYLSYGISGYSSQLSSEQVEIMDKAVRLYNKNRYGVEYAGDIDPAVIDEYVRLRAEKLKQEQELLNSQHTIQFTAADNAGNTDGIGPRFGTIERSS